MRLFKRMLKILGLVIGTLVLAVVVLLAVTLMGRRPIVDGYEVNGIRVIKDSTVTVGVLSLGEREVALIDTGNDDTGKAILAELSRRQLGPEAVKTILLTHGHPDHMAGVHLFPRAQVLALTSEIPLIEGRTSLQGPLRFFFRRHPTGIRVTRALGDGERVTLGRLVLRVFAIPGHSPGCAAYLVSDVLFLGDSADATKEGRLRGAPWLFSDSQAQNRASLVQLAERLVREKVTVKALVLSHSGALSEGLAPLTDFHN
jgi:glyoxylase-like metal-dependent hydrolase (beta-lactamase superfamily II)